MVTGPFESYPPSALPRTAVVADILAYHDWNKHQTER